MPLPKRKRPKSKKVNISVREKWKQILDGVSKEEVPVAVLDAITVNLKDGTIVKIDIRELLEDGLDPVEIEEQLNERLEKLDDYITDVDFFVSIDAIAETVQPVTDDILKRLF